MALPETVTKEEYEKLPEVVRDHYKEAEGKFHLALVPKTRLDEFRNNNINLLREKDELTKTVEKFKDIDPEKAREALKKLQEIDDKKLLDAGKIDELVQQKTERMRADYENQATAFNKKITGLEKEKDSLGERLSQLLIDNAIREAALEPDLGVQTSAIADLILRGRRIWHVRDGKAVPLRDGKDVIYGKDPNVPMTTREWIEGLRSEAPHLFKTSAGGGASNDKGAGAPTNKKRSQMTVAEKSAFIEKHGKEAYEKLSY